MSSTLEASQAGLVQLKELGPALYFGKDNKVKATGPPGTGMTEYNELLCEGHNCAHMAVVGANCTHDPAQLEDSMDLVWTCSESLAVPDPRFRPPRHTAHSAIFLFNSVRVVCDSNISAAKGLAWTPLDTTAVAKAAGNPAAPESVTVFVDPSTCRLVFSISNLGAPDEHATLVLLLLCAFMFVMLLVCPAALAHCFGPDSTPSESIDTYLPQSMRGRPDEYANIVQSIVQGAESYGALRGHGNNTMRHRPSVPAARAEGNIASHVAFSMRPPDTYPIDSVR